MNKNEGDFLDNPPNLMNPQIGGFQLDPSQFEAMGIDPGQFDYNNQLGGAPSMDSPNYNMDYQQQVGLLGHLYESTVRTIAVNIALALVSASAFV